MTRYSRNAKCQTHVVDSDAFVVTRTTIHHLNATAAVIWLALEEPASRRELHAILREVFPAVPPQRLSADLGKVIANFAAKRLIAPLRTSAASRAGHAARGALPSGPRQAPARRAAPGRSRPRLAPSGRG